MLMLTFAPFVTVTALVFIAPERWGGMTDLDYLLTLTFFGLITVPLWFTYIPMIVLAPLLMKRAQRQPWFFSLPIPALFGLSIALGALCGVGVMALPVFMSISEDLRMALNWAGAGGISGAVTLSLITVFYRWPKPTD